MVACDGWKESRSGWFVLEFVATILPELVAVVGGHGEVTSAGEGDKGGD